MVYFWGIAALAAAIVIARFAAKSFQRQRLARPSRSRASDPRVQRAAGRPDRPIPPHRGREWQAPWPALDRLRAIGAPLFAVDDATGDLIALVAATVSFEAIEGGGMEDVEAVGNLRSATAVFMHRGAGWITDGRVIFNLEPPEALAKFGTLRRLT